MYYWIVLFCLVGLAASQCDDRNTEYDDKYWFRPGSDGSDDLYIAGPKKQHRYDRTDISVSAIARYLIGAGQKMEQFCTAHSDRPLKEVYGVEHFKLRVQLAEFTEDNIQVKVRQRLVSIQAKNCDVEYAAVRLLPDVVDARSAVWKLESGVLCVMFPYNISPASSISSRCGRYMDNGVTVVPRSAAGTVYRPDYDLTFGDEDFRRAIMQYLRHHPLPGGNPSQRIHPPHEGPYPSTEDEDSNEYVDDNKVPAK